MSKKILEAPVIFGALCDRTLDLPRGLSRALKARVPDAVLLPFKVEKRHLKNVITCMRLMDVAGLVVIGSHRRAILRHLPHLDASARKAGSVDVIARRSHGSRFTAHGSRYSDFIGFNAAGAQRTIVDLLTASM